MRTRSEKRQRQAHHEHDDDAATQSGDSGASLVRRVVPHIGSIGLQALDGGALNRLYAHLLENGRVRRRQSSGLKPRTVRYVHTIIHATLDDAAKWRRIPVNAANQATPPSAKLAKAPEMKVWSTAELTIFLHLNEGNRYQPWSPTPP